MKKKKKSKARTTRLAALALLGGSIALAGAAAPGCGGGDSCENYCELSSDCDVSLAVRRDCLEGCRQEQAQADAHGCGSEFEDLLDCASDAADVCKPNECVGEVFAFIGCAQAFCEKNPNHADCSSAVDPDPPND